MSYQDELFRDLEQKTKEIVNEMPDYMRKFFSHLKGQGMSPRTRLQYAYDLNRFYSYLSSSPGFKSENIKTLTAHDILDKLTIDDYQEYIESLEYYKKTDKNGNVTTSLSSPSMIARKVASLRSMLSYFHKIGEISENISDLIDSPKIPEKTIVALDKDGVARLLKAITDTEGMSDREIKRHKLIEKRDYAIMMLLLGTGIRVSELVGIDLSDIDFYNASILITRKGGDEDEVYFGSQVESALDDYLLNCRDELLKGNEEDAFFVSMQHKRITERSVEILVKNYALKANLNMKVTPHTMRRTYGTNLYEETSDIYLVADALHHASVETTKKHYAKLSKDHKRIAAAKSSTLFENN